MGWFGVFGVLVLWAGFVCAWCLRVCVDACVLVRWCVCVLMSWFCGLALRVLGICVGVRFGALVLWVGFVCAWWLRVC